MKYFSKGAVGAALTFICLLTSIPAKGQTTSGKVLVQGVSGEVSFSSDGEKWEEPKANTFLDRGVTIKTGAEGAADLMLQYNGTALRLVPNSALNLAKLNKEQAGEDVITETSLQLLAGSLVGSQRKLA